jgi:serine/threonine protein kinase
MGKCSLCGAEGVTKATCPLNKPKPNHPNPEKHNVPNKSNSNDTLHNLLDNIKKNCTKESGNIDILKLNIENKPVKELKKTVKPTKKSAKKPIKNPGKNKVIDLKTIFKSGYVFTPESKYSSLNHTVIKQLLSDEASSIVLLVNDNKNNKEYVIKVESLGTPTPQIYNEEAVLFWINNDRGISQTKNILKDKSFVKGGIPKLYSRIIMYNHTPEIKTRLFIEEKLDVSLSQIIQDKKIPIPEIKKKGLEYIKILQYIHANGYIHLDIKPPNLMINKENGKEKYYIIDFGISKKWYGERYVKNKPKTYYISNKPHSGEGTPLYKSINAERANLKIKGNFFSRSEDIESLGYLLLEMFLGGLPWKSLENEDSPRKRLDAKLKSIEYVKKIPDDNLRNAITLMVTNYDKPYDYEPEYKRLLDLLK